MPAVIELHHPQAYDIWAMWRATDRRFLPSQLLDEDEALLNDMLVLDSVYGLIKAKHDAAKDK